MSEAYVTKYDQMPIPPVERQTEYFDAGAVRIGVEYRLLNDAIAAASETERARGGDTSDLALVDDRGVSIHVLCDEGLEHLRFDCFKEDPHYHYISWKQRFNHMIHLDPVADGDPVAWALERIRTRLPQMLVRAGAADLAARVDPTRIEALLPRLWEAASRLRYHADESAVLRDALESEEGGG